MYEGLSFNGSRVRLGTSLNCDRIILKNTDVKEYQTLLNAQVHLSLFNPVLRNQKWNGFGIRTALLHAWNESLGILETVFESGENLESLLRETIRSPRSSILEAIGELFLIFKRTGFLWGDFAPRNILINSEKKILCLVDFERTSGFIRGGVSDEVFSHYFSHYAWEEFSCFLRKAEQELVFPPWINEGYHEPVLFENISSSRKRSLLRHIHGHNKEYTVEEIHAIEKLMAEVATPIHQDGLFHFPMDFLDPIASRGGANEYVKAVMEFYKLGRYQWLSKIRKLAESF